MYKLNCQVCNKSFETYNPKQLSCSYSCSNISRGYFFKNKTYCIWCNQIISRPSPSKKHVFCSKTCEASYRSRDRIEIKCKICEKSVMVSNSHRNKKFCSRKCWRIHRKNNPIKYKLQYRSFGECAIACLLKINYPHLKVINNDREQLKGYELDIWLPDLKIGIEYNGPHHFKPVYGDEIFEKTKIADKNKLQIANDNGIKIIYIVPIGSISKTSKTIMKTTFIQCCKDIGLPEPTILDIPTDTIIKEQNGNKPNSHRFINLGRKWTDSQHIKFKLKRNKTYILKSEIGEIVTVYRLQDFCQQYKMQYTYAMMRFNHRKPCKGWTCIDCYFPK